MISNEQMDTLIGRLKVYGSESGRGKDHPNAIACRTAASVIIEQQAEIERLREAIGSNEFPRVRRVREVLGSGLTWICEVSHSQRSFHHTQEDAEAARAALGANQ